MDELTSALNGLFGIAFMIFFASIVVEAFLMAFNIHAPGIVTLVFYTFVCSIIAFVSMGIFRLLMLIVRLIILILTGR